MAAVTETVIRELAGFKAERGAVTTCYLDVDGARLRRQQDLERELDILVRGAKKRLNGDRSPERDLDRIADFVRGGIDRSHTKGLAIFSCVQSDLWEVVSLPVPVRNQVVIGHGPAVGQLEAVVQDYSRMGVLLVDRQRARMFVFEWGELIEHSELFEELPRDYDTRGEKERGDTSAHVHELADRHLRHAATVAFEVYKDRGFETLALGVADDLGPALEGHLHEYLRGILAGRIHAPVTASVASIRAEARDLHIDLERARESRLVEELRDALGAGRRACAELGPVLEAICENRAERVLVSAGYSESGWRCGCGCLTTVGRRCPRCDEEMAPVDDVVEDAVFEAMAHGVAVDLCSANADLDVLGRIGAFLRY